VGRGSAPLTVLLDTHVLLWWRAGGVRLSETARSSVSQAATMLVSPITFWEVGTLLRQRRIDLDRPLAVWVIDVLAEPRLDVAALTPGAAAFAGSVPADFPGDPADRMIYATARERGVTLISRDERLREYAARAGDVRVVW
jgi:PIN domain nuclease of toxin-antitoxin system